MHVFLWSIALLGHVHGFNPLAVVPLQRAPQVQPQTAPNDVVDPRIRPYPLPVFFPPRPPSSPALSALPSEMMTAPTATRMAQERAPMAVQEAWSASRLQGLAEQENGHLQSTDQASMQASGGSWS